MVKKNSLLFFSRFLFVLSFASVQASEKKGEPVNLEWQLPAQWDLQQKSFIRFSAKATQNEEGHLFQKGSNKDYLFTGEIIVTGNIDQQFIVCASQVSSNDFGQASVVADTANPIHILRLTKNTGILTIIDGRACPAQLDLQYPYNPVQMMRSPAPFLVITARKKETRQHDAPILPLPIGSPDSKEAYLSGLLGAGSGFDDHNDFKRPPFIPAQDKTSFNLLLIPGLSLPVNWRDYLPVTGLYYWLADQPESPDGLTVLVKFHGRPPITLRISRGEYPDMAEHLLNAWQLLRWLMPKLNGREDFILQLVNMISDTSETSLIWNEETCTRIQQQLMIALEQSDTEFSLEFERYKLGESLFQRVADASPHSTIVTLPDNVQRSSGTTTLSTRKSSRELSLMPDEGSDQLSESKPEQQAGSLLPPQIEEPASEAGLQESKDYFIIVVGCTEYKIRKQQLLPERRGQEPLDEITAVESVSKAEIPLNLLEDRQAIPNLEQVASANGTPLDIMVRYGTDKTKQSLLKYYPTKVVFVDGEHLAASQALSSTHYYSGQSVAGISAHEKSNHFKISAEDQCSICRELLIQSGHLVSADCHDFFHIPCLSYYLRAGSGSKAEKTCSVCQNRVPHIAKLFTRKEDMEEELRLAARSGDVSVVTAVLSADVNPDAAGFEGSTALHLAIWDGHYDIVNRLIQYGADTDKKDQHGLTPLEIASKAEQESISSLLQEAAETPSAFYIVGRGLPEKLRQWLDMGGDSNVYRQPDGLSLLHLAVRNNHPDIVQILLNQAKQLNQNIVDTTDTNKQTPMHVACMLGYEEVVRILLENDALTDIPDKSGNTALELALAKKHLTIARLIQKKNGVSGEEVERLWVLGQEEKMPHKKPQLNPKYSLSAIKNPFSQEQVIRQKGGASDRAIEKNRAIEKDRHPDAEGSKSRSPLYQAIINSQLDKVQELLSSGANQLGKIERDQPLMRLAVGIGYPDMVKLLMQFGGDLESRDEDDWTVMHLAAAMNRWQVISVLNEFRASFVEKDNNGNTPLHIAANKGHAMTVSALVSIDTNIDIDAKNYNGYSPLHLAAKEGHTEVVRSLIGEYKANRNIRSSSGETLLHLAAQNACLDNVRLLINEFELDVDLKDYRGNTPFHFAAAEGHSETVSLLINEFGANKSDRNKDNWNALHFAAREGQADMIKLLVTTFNLNPESKTRESNTPLHIASIYGQNNVIQLLVNDLAVDRQAQNNLGKTALHLAAEYDQVDAINLLINELGINPESPDLQNQTALHLAARQGHLSSLKTLIDLGANPQAITIKGENILHLTASHGRLEALKMLLAGVMKNPDVVTHLGETPLHLAALHNQTTIIDALIAEFHANPEAKNKEGVTLMHILAANGLTDAIAKLVYTHGVNQHVLDDHGWTPLHYAVKGGYIDLVDELVMLYGLNTKTTTTKMQTLLHIAAEFGKTEMVRHLIKQFSADQAAKNFAGQIPLHSAIASAHAETADTLITEFSSNPEAQDFKGWTPLHQAVGQGKLSMVQSFLVQYQVNLEATSNGGLTPLLLSAARGYTNIMRVLINNFSANKKAVTNEKLTLLHLASQHGHDKTVSALIQEFGFKPEQKNGNGMTPLHIAAIHGHSNVVEKLITHFGVNTEERYQEASALTAMHLAARNGHADTVQALYKLGANPQAKTASPTSQLLQPKRIYQMMDVMLKPHLISLPSNVNPFSKAMNFEDQVTPLHLAAQEGHTHVIRKMARWGLFETPTTHAKQTALHYAVIAGNEETTYELIRHGSDMDAQDYKGYTPLHLAIVNKQLALVKLLITMGADMTITDSDGYSSLQLAIREKQQDTIEELLKHRPNLELKERKNQEAPIHLATLQGDVNTVRLLISLGANIHSKNREGKTALHLAVEKENLEITLALVELGAEINIPTSSGDTSLHVSASTNNIAIAKILIRGMGDLEARNAENNTPLHIAAKNKHLDMLVFLVAEGASMSAKNSGGNTPFHFIFKYFPETQINSFFHDHASLIHPKILLERNHKGQLPSSNLVRLGISQSLRNFVKVLASPESDRGFAALNEAVSKNDDFRLLFLLRRGVKTTKSDDRGWTPLHFASWLGHDKIVDLLLNQPGQKVDALTLPPRRNIKEKETDNCLTSLLLATQNGSHSAAFKLIERGASLDATDKHGKTPLHFMLEYFSEEPLIAFYGKYAGRLSPTRLSAVDKHGLSPLDYLKNRDIPFKTQALFYSLIEHNAASSSSTPPLTSDSNQCPICMENTFRDEMYGICMVCSISICEDCYKKTHDCPFCTNTLETQKTPRQLQNCSD